MNRFLKFLRVGTAALAALALAAAPAVPVRADDAETEEKPATRIQISPVSNRVFVASGQSLTYTMTVDNTGSKSFKFKVYAAPYSVENETYNPSFSKETSRTQISRWITFNDGSGNFKGEVTFELQPDERRDVEYKITVPKDVPAGGQYAAIFAQTIPDETVKQSGIYASSRIGMIIYARTDGKTRDSVKFENGRVESFMTGGSLNGQVNVVDDGNTDFTVNAKLTAKTIFGQELPAVEKDFDVLPDTTRTVRLEVENSPSIGFFNVTFTVKALDQTFEKTQLVAIIPVYIIVIMVILLTILIAWIIILVKKRKFQRKRLIV